MTTINPKSEIRNPIRLRSEEATARQEEARNSKSEAGNPNSGRGRLVPAISWSQSDQMMVAVGFNPRCNDFIKSSVAERRLKRAFLRASGIQGHPAFNRRYATETYLWHFQPWVKNPRLPSTVAPRPGESQRDSASKPRVAPLLRARAGLPWVNVVKLRSTLKGLRLPFCTAPRRPYPRATDATTPLGLINFYRLPRVARVPVFASLRRGHAQPWAGGRNPFGIGETNLTDLL